MLLIEDPSVLIIKDAMTRIAGWFVLPAFVIALAWEYFNEFKFFEVVKKLVLVLVFISAFYSIHKEGVELSLKYSDELLREISPRNVFLRKWSEVKIKPNEEKTSQKTGWNVVESFIIPNLNDLIGTALFLMSKLSIWILKLIYSTVYHLTYIFAPLTAVLYFFPISRGSINGSILSSFWCMLLPFVLVAILALVGNSMQASANQGDFIFSSMDQILWLFGVTLLIASTPIITFGLLKGGGVAMSGSAVGALMTNSATKFLNAVPGVSRQTGRIGEQAMNLGRYGADKISNGINRGHKELSSLPKTPNHINKNNMDGMKPVGDHYDKSSLEKDDLQKGNSAKSGMSSQIKQNSNASNDLPKTRKESGFNSQSSSVDNKGESKLAKGLSRIISINENIRTSAVSQPRSFVNTQKIQKEASSPMNTTMKPIEKSKNFQERSIKESMPKNSNRSKRNNSFKRTQTRDRLNFRREL
ncbi:hypothetical protein SHI21_19600 [Bacteriovorax sp. PP10]|uniref:TrbL/VirB6 plasmid conjugal transfer protein n=1 Tax=Bacteriovorax antarcticus TaxID=3088717 RepID=A0ABU5VZE5_9BACT|nr:hypothetical protein [Bacteriovorax sp. PP10]MEA9358451.1 hypothetical protein [Bacteriovorax sp. PP10]